MHQLIIPTPLRKFTGGLGVFESEAADVQGLIASLVSAHEGLKPHILDESGALRTFIRVYVGDEDIQELQGEATPLPPKSEVSIIPAIAGGIA